VANEGDKAAGESPRPSFAKDFPREPTLDALVEAFEAGDFARAREGADKLVREAQDADVRRAAAVLGARTRADPLQTLLLGLSLALLVALSAWWIAHSGRG
jgi:hypothetical protein